MNNVAPLRETPKILAEVAHTPWDEMECAKGLLASVLHRAEMAERDLAYYTACKSEHARKRSGSYYTPVDVAKFFWNQFFDAQCITDATKAREFVQTHRFIEPSCGSGVLVYALLDKLINLGLPLEVMRDLDLHLVDINASALEYSKRQFSLINDSLGTAYFTPSFEHTNFMCYNDLVSTRPTVVFGNPPFAANPRGSTWKNTYADFLDRCLEKVSPLAAVHFIVPLSLAFSRDYSALRHKFRTRNFTVFASHFDNIPDTLFKSGKPQNDNSNKANSQRCTIISAMASSEHRLFSSKLHQWSAAGRAALLSHRAKYEDVAGCRHGDQFIRPSSPEMAQYLQHKTFPYSLGDLVPAQGNHNLYIGGVARNYISVRGEGGSGIQNFSFDNRMNFYRFLGLVASDVFLEYWRSVGDGFHVTRTNILDFPVSAALDGLIEASMPGIKSMWNRRKQFEKTKLNSGILVRSYDFSPVAPKFVPALL